MARTGNIYRALSGQILGETEKAIRFQVHAPDHTKHGSTEWFPISQMASIHRCYDEIEGTFDILMLSEWILGQKSMLQASADKNPALLVAIGRKEVPAMSDAVRRMRDSMKANRLPYKDDEGRLDDDDIPF